MPAFVPARAFADDVSDAQSALDSAEAQLSQITSEYNQLLAQAESLQSDIDSAAAGVFDAQTAVDEGKQKLAKYATSEYKMGGLSLVQILLDSQNFSELVNNLHYYQSIQDDQAREIENQKQREKTYKEKLSDLNNKQETQQQAISSAEAKKEEAAKVVSNATSTLSEAQATAEAARLAELQRQAEEMAAEQAAVEVAATANAAPSNDTTTYDTTDNYTTDVDTSTDDWTTGIASAYGAVSDGTLGGTTANGSIVTEDSMGVAIPLAWNKRYLLGHTVEISYGGRTVTAVINDLGGMGGGSRSLDLQPGVWRALGATSCFDWGLRTVSYRIL